MVDTEPDINHVISLSIYYTSFTMHQLSYSKFAVTKISYNYDYFKLD